MTDPAIDLIDAEVARLRALLAALEAARAALSGGKAPAPADAPPPGPAPGPGHRPYLLLVALAERPGAPARELAAATGIPAPTVHKILPACPWFEKRGPGPRDQYRVSAAGLAELRRAGGPATGTTGGGSPGTCTTGAGPGATSPPATSG